MSIEWALALTVGVVIGLWIVQTKHRMELERLKWKQIEGGLSHSAQHEAAMIALKELSPLSSDICRIRARLDRLEESKTSAAKRCDKCGCLWAHSSE